MSVCKHMFNLILFSLFLVLYYHYLLNLQWNGHHYLIIIWKISLTSYCLQFSKHLCFTLSNSQIDCKILEPVSILETNILGHFLGNILRNEVRFGSCCSRQAR